MGLVLSRSLLLAPTLLLLGCGGENDPQGQPAGGGATSGSSGGATATGGASTAVTGGAPGSSSGGSMSQGSGGSASGGGAGVTRADCKRGLAYGQHSKSDMSVLSPAMNWWYNWYFKPDEGVSDGSYRDWKIQYVPMVWGGSFSKDELIAQIPSDAKYLLGFNEPNFGKEANLTAAEAAALWPQVEEIADALDLSLVSPAVNFCGGDCTETDPFKYLDDFFAACSGCRVDKVAFHIYVDCNKAGDNMAQWLINHVETYKSRFSQPLWLTEFACTNASNFTEQAEFLEAATTYLEAEPRVERYAWFSGRFEGIPYVDLLGADGALTELGQAYLSVPQPAHCQLP